MADHVQKTLKFIVTCWDGDIYILEGYDSVEQIREAIGGLEWVIMPNGAEIKSSAIAKIQPYDDYRFQRDTAFRHKRGQYLYLPADPSKQATWDDNGHTEANADVKSITGSIQNLPALEKPTGKRLTGGK